AQSLLQRGQATDGEPRFAMLETLREFGLDRLVEWGEEEQTRGAHATYFLYLTEQAELQLTGPEQQAWLDRLETEQANLREAFEWTPARQPPPPVPLGGRAR